MVWLEWGVRSVELCFLFHVQCFICVCCISGYINFDVQYIFATMLLSSIHNCRLLRVSYNTVVCLVIYPFVRKHNAQRLNVKMTKEMVYVNMTAACDKRLSYDTHPLARLLRNNIVIRLSRKSIKTIISSTVKFGYKKVWIERWMLSCMNETCMQM